MVIVGAGECGTRAAFALREAGYDGSITLVGDEPGLPYERPPLSKPGADNACLKPICSAERLAEARIAYRPATKVGGIDLTCRTVVVDGGRISYDKLLLATGARARALSCPGGDGAVTFRTHAEADVLYGRLLGASGVVLIGAGLIGMELAAHLRGRGLAVTVVEAAPMALGRAVPRRLADRIVARHLAEGVELLLDTAVDRIDGSTVHLVDGRSRDGDAVLAAIGVVPNTALAERAGLAVGDGIVVDERLRTSDPHVFAAGDCANAPSRHSDRPLRLENWRNAREQGSHAARAMLGDTAPFRSVPWFWSDQFDLGLQVAGLWHSERTVVARMQGEAEILFQFADDGRLTCAAGLGPGSSVAKDIRIADRLIERGVRPNRAVLSDAEVDLKRFLKA